MPTAKEIYTSVRSDIQTLAGSGLAATMQVHANDRMKAFADAVLQEAAAEKFPGGTLGTGKKYQELRDYLARDAATVCMSQVGTINKNLGGRLGDLGSVLTGTYTVPTAPQYVATVDEVVGACKKVAADSMVQKNAVKALMDGHSIGLDASKFRLGSAGLFLPLTIGRTSEQFMQDLARRTSGGMPPATDVALPVRPVAAMPPAVLEQATRIATAGIPSSTQQSGAVRPPSPSPGQSNGARRG